MAEHVEERKLITWVELSTMKPHPKRRRGVVIDGLIGISDDGYITHIPTGAGIGGGRYADGTIREIKDKKAFAIWMLEQDPEGWASSKSYGMGEVLTKALQDRLVVTRNSYPGE